jgi:L-threonylcarbamoyladenylate synthase
MDFTIDIEHCLKVLQDGGLILYPTDTIWGIGCDATNAEAVKKIYEIKNRAETKSMIVLVAEEKDVLKYIAHPDMRVFDYLQQLQKPTTVIYDGAIGLADNLIGPDGSIALRIVQDTFCRHLIKRFRKPIVSTSANISGQDTPACFAKISKEIIDSAGYVVKYRQEEKKPAKPSALIRWTKQGTVEVVRP